MRCKSRTATKPGQATHRSGRTALRLVVVAFGLVTVGWIGWQAGVFEVVDGDLFWKAPGVPVRVRLQHLYDLDFHDRAYVVDEGVTYRLGPGVGKSRPRYRVKRRFEEGFENAKHVRDLVGIERGWTSLTLQGPRSRSIAAYNALRDRVLSGHGDFVDNRLDVVQGSAHGGARALLATAEAPTMGMVCSKSSLDTELLYFRRGDRVTVSFWLKLKEPEKFLTIADLESTHVYQYPGMRIRINDGCLDWELAKWYRKRVYRQAAAQPIRVGVDTWIHVKGELELTERPTGRIRLWQDDELIVDCQGQTLPFADAIYDHLSVGITALAPGSGSGRVLIDDLRVAAE